jgi:hypothetical protein
MSQHEPSFEELMADIGRRLRPVLPEMPAADFDALVHRIATVKAKWSHTPVTPPQSSPAVSPRRRRPDRA